MKKTLALVLTVALVLSVIILPTSVSAEITDVSTYLQDFESQDYADKFASSSYYHVSTELSTEKAHSGSKSVKFTDLNLPSKQHLIPLGKTIGNAERFIVDFWIWADSSVNFSNVTTSRVYCYQESWWNSSTPASHDGSSPAPSNVWDLVPVKTFNISTTVSGTGWNHISFEFWGNTKYAANNDFFLDITNGNLLGGNIYIDDLRVRKTHWAHGGTTVTLKDGYFDGGNNDFVDYFPTGSTLPTPTRDGYEFIGWFSDSNFTNKVTTASATENISTTYYAAWKGQQIFYDFEDGVVPSNYANRCELVTEGSAFGNNCLKLPTSIGDNHLHLGELKPNTKYYIDFYIKSNVTTGTSITYSIGPGYPGTYLKRAFDNPITVYPTWQGWHHVSSWVVMPEDNVVTGNDGYDYKNFLTLSLSSGSGDFWVDNIRIFEDTNAVVSVKPHNTFNNFNENYENSNPFYGYSGDPLDRTPTARDGYDFVNWYVDDQWSRRVFTFDKSIPTVYARWTESEYDYYYDFEDFSNEMSGASVSTDYAHSGTKSIKVNGFNNCGFAIGKINAGKKYMLDYYVYQPQADSCSGYIKTRLGSWPTHAEYDQLKDGTNFEYPLYYNKAVKGWTHYSHTFTVPQNLNSVLGDYSEQIYDTLWFYTSLMNNYNSGEFYVDDLTLVEVNNGVTTTNVNFYHSHDYIDMDYVKTERVSGSVITDVSTAPGYDFHGWYTGFNGTGNKVERVSYQKMDVLYAYCTPKAATPATDVASGEANVDASACVISGSAVTTDGLSDVMIDTSADMSSALNIAELTSGYNLAQEYEKLYANKVYPKSDPKTYVETFFEVTPKTYTVTDPTTKSFKLGITPKYNIVVSSAATPEEIIKSGVGKNAVDMNDTPLDLAVSSATTVTVPLPEDFLTSRKDTIRVYHFNSDGITVNETLDGVVDLENNTVTFTTNGFSDFELDLVPATASNNASLSLLDDIAVNFYLDIDAYALDFSNIKVKLTYDHTRNYTRDVRTDVYTYNGEKFVCTEMDAVAERNTGSDSDKKDRFEFSVKMLPTQVKEKITVQIYDGDTLLKEIKKSEGGYSVYDYCNKVKNADSGYKPELKTLCEAIINYAAYAQVEFDYRNNVYKDLSDEDVKAKLIPAEEFDSDFGNTDFTNLENETYKMTVSGGIDGMKVKTISFMCLNESSFRCFFADSATGKYYTPLSELEGYTCSLNGVIGSSMGVRFGEVQSLSRAYVEVYGIEAANLDGKFTVTVTSDKDESFVIEACALSYARSAYNSSSSDVNLRNFVKALYQYNTAADNYFGNLS